LLFYKLWWSYDFYVKVYLLPTTAQWLYVQ
jgi:hypothetical protein